MKAFNTANLCIYASGALVALLGAVVMAAWATGHHATFQLSENFVPMAFNTAFCFLLCGVGILMARGQWSPISMACAGFVAVFALIIGLQYFIGKNIGVDALFLDQHLQVRSSHPGRMAPNTVLYFLLATSGLMAWHLVKQDSKKFLILSITGCIVFLLALVALLGYVIKLESAYSWWGMSDMAPLTALGFIFTGCGLLGIAYSHAETAKDKNLRLIKPIFAAALGITLTLLISQGLLVRDKNHIQRLSSEQSSKAAHIIKLEIENDIAALKRMHDRLIVSGYPNIAAWERDAQNYVRDNPAYKSIALLNEEHAILKDIQQYADDGLWRGVLKNPGVQSVWNSLSGSATLKVPYADKMLILFLLPLEENAIGRGYLAGLYDVQREVENLPPAGHGLQSYLQIMDEDGEIYSNKTGEDYVWEFMHEEKISFYGLNWKIRETMNGSRPSNRGLVILILVVGAGLSLLLAKSMWQAQEIRVHSQRLQDTEERSARAINAAQVGLWDWDLETESLIWGGSAWQIFETTSNEKIPTKADDVLNMIHEEDREFAQEQVMKGIEGERMFTVEYRTKRMDGREIWVQSRGKVADYKNGVPVRVSGTLTDITKRKQSEEELTRSNQELERFAYVASHDLKAPLRSIDNLAKWVLEDTVDILPDDSRDKLKLLRGRITRLEALLSDILAYSRAGRISDDPVEIDMNELVSTIIQSHVGENFRATIEGVLPTITSPRTPLEQIFGNLLSNACKHHDKNTGTITISSQDKGHFYEYIIKDDGPGIAPEFHGRVFEMFQTLQPRDKVDGSGIGMSIIKKLVEWRGGRVWIVSIPGIRGTAVHFLWPKK